MFYFSISASRFGCRFISSSSSPRRVSQSKYGTTPFLLSFRRASHRRIFFSSRVNSRCLRGPLRFLPYESFFRVELIPVRVFRRRDCRRELSVHISNFFFVVLLLLLLSFRESESNFQNLCYRPDEASSPRDVPDALFSSLSSLPFVSSSSFYSSSVVLSSFERPPWKKKDLNFRVLLLEGLPPFPVSSGLRLFAKAPKVVVFLLSSFEYASLGSAQNLFGSKRSKKKRQ